MLDDAYVWLVKQVLVSVVYEKQCAAARNRLAVFSVSD